MKYLITFILLFFVPVAEATTAPDWVLGKGHPSYDSLRYLVGVGHSDKGIISANESARAELIKSISVRVNAVTNDYNSTDKSFYESSEDEIYCYFDTYLIKMIFYFLSNKR